MKNQDERTGIAMHVKETGHSIDWDIFPILDSDRNHMRVKAKGSVSIIALLEVETLSNQS